MKRIVFIPDAGFHEAGVFVELEKEEELKYNTRYEREEHEHLALVCSAMTIAYRHEFQPEPAQTASGADGDPPQLEPKPSRYLSATGHIKPRGSSGTTRDKLSLFGSDKEHDTVEVIIKEVSPGATDKAEFWGVPRRVDVDNDQEERFYLMVPVETSLMDQLIADLEKGDTRLVVEVDLGDFPGYFASWSVSIRDERVFKLLYNKGDIENPEDVPADFWKRQTRKDRHGFDILRPSVRLTVSRPIGDQALPAFLGDEDDDDDFETYTPDKTEETETSEENDAASLTAMASAATARLLKQTNNRILWAAFIIAAAILLTKL